MKKTFFILFIAAFSLGSCNKDMPKPVTKEDIKKKTDSIFVERAKEHDHMAQQDLQHRMKIEVKVKVDSMVNVLKSKRDSAVNATAAQKAKDSLAAKPATPK